MMLKKMLQIIVKLWSHFGQALESYYKINENNLTHGEA